MSSPSEQLNVSEIFASIQGEGGLLGTPSVFVRTSGCNLRCQWNGTRCDTPYTSWDARGRLMTVAQIVEETRSLRERRPHLTHLVLTGGEPLLQPAVVPLCAALSQEGLHLTVETNGTIARPIEANLVSLSPKLHSSVPPDDRLGPMHEAARINSEALRHFLERDVCQLKFVVNEAEDEQEIDHLLESLGVEIPPEIVYLMPQGVTAEELATHARLCVGICLRRGWRFTPRAHIEIYGNAPGT